MRLGERQQRLLRDIFRLSLPQADASRKTKDRLAKSLGQSIPRVAIGIIAQVREHAGGGHPGHRHPKRSELLTKAYRIRDCKSREIELPAGNTPQNLTQWSNR